jgi:hypothetical protein
VGRDVVDGAVEAADGVSAESLGAAGERAETAVGVGVRHLPEGVRRRGWRIHGVDGGRGIGIYDFGGEVTDETVICARQINSLTKVGTLALLNEGLPQRSSLTVL